MMTARLLAGLALMTATAIGVAAEESSMAVRPEAFLASDSDGNEVSKTSLSWKWQYSDREHWMGIDVQRARFSGEDWSHEEERVYGRAAGTFGASEVSDDTWRWQARLGTNGDTALGSISLNTEGPNRREIFFERGTGNSRRRRA
jgi:hypothetical protein